MKWIDFTSWLRGDDGHPYAVVTEPSYFRRAESRVEGPFTRRRAFWFARCFLIREPYGEARIYRGNGGNSWPPPMDP